MIRQATQSDMPELMRMAKEFHYKANGKRIIKYEDNLDGWEGWFNTCTSSPMFCCYVFETEGKLGGFVTGLTGPALFAPGKTKLAYEGNLWVDKEHRKNGVAKQLVETLLNWAKTMGCSHLTMASQRFFGFEKADKLYTSLGFELEEKHYMKAVN